MRFAALTAVLVLGACSRPAPPPTHEAGPAVPEPGLQAKPVLVSMAGEVNAMPSLAALGDRVVLVWTGTKDGAMSVYSAVSEDRGATFNVQRRVNDRPGDVSANVEQPPRVAISSAGITVIWSSKKSGESAIRMARSTDGGKTFNRAITIHNPALTGARGWESIAAGADGSVRVAWLDGRNARAAMPIPAPAKAPHMVHALMDHSSSPRQDVYEAVVDATGKVSEAQVATNVCFCCKTAVAIGSRGQVFTAWRHIFPGSIRDIAMAVSSDGGRSFGPLARVSEDKWEIAGCPEDGAALAVDGGDTVHVVWPTVVDDGQPQKAVFYTSTKDGRTFGPRVRLSSVSQEEAAHPQIAAASAGTVAAVWDEPHGDSRQIVLRTARPDGSWNAAQTLSSSGTASHPVAVAVADGLLVGWASGEGTSSAIALQQIGISPPTAKPPAHNSHIFRGRVESVDAKTGRLTVAGEDVEGWMGAMTMVYGVDDKDVLASIKAGSLITATVYDGDFNTLHHVEIVR